MNNSDKMGYVTSDGDKTEGEAEKRPRLTNAEKQARFRERRSKEAERMKRIVMKTEKLNESIRALPGDSVTLPLNLFSEETEATIDNLTQYVNNTLKVRETAQTVRKAKKGGTQKK